MPPRKGHPPRLAGWDYSRPGAYFVTFTVAGRLRCLSTVRGGRVKLGTAGEIVEQCWQELPRSFPVRLDARVIMPDHVHAILILTLPSETSRPASYRALIEEEASGGALTSGGALINQGPTGDGQGSLQPMMADPRMVLGKVVRAWKARSTRLIRTAGAPSFAWQSRYYEHVIRDRPTLDRVRQYIANNPLRWNHG
jgi:REP element-mobilizing transposase RayT